MADARFSAADYLAALQAHMPRGRVWPREPEAVQTALLAGLAASLERLDARAQTLLQDGFIASTYELLTEWEATLGLPDPIIGVLPTVMQRRALALARFIATGGQSVPYFIQLAGALGYVITITEFRPFSAGDFAGMPCNGDDWAHTWRVNAPLNSIVYFTAGSSAGEPLSAWGNEQLERELTRYAPAHTKLLFAYS